MRVQLYRRNLSTKDILLAGKHKNSSLKLSHTVAEVKEKSKYKGSLKLTFSIEFMWFLEY